MRRSKMAVIGLGNRLLSDEGAGLHAVELLKEKLKKKNGAPDVDVDLVEAGTPGPGLFYQFDGREKIIFIDAGNCGLKPGEYKRFRPREVVSRKETNRYSLHEFDLIECLEMAKSIQKTGKVDVVIYCIQPSEMKMTETLSPVVKKSLPFLVQEVYDDVIRGLHHE